MITAFYTARHARLTPDAPALVCEGVRLSYGALEDRVARVAGRLVERGCTDGRRVVALAGNRVELAELLLACARVGATFIPLNTRAGDLALGRMLRTSSPTVVFADEARLDVVDPYAREARVEVVAFGDGLTTDADYLGAEPVEQGQHPCSIGQPAVVIFTSGTTGAPKGAVLSHENVVASALATILDRGVGHDEVFLSGLPMFHVGGLLGLVPSLLLGARSVILPTGGFDGESVLGLMERESVTTAFLVPTQWADVVEAARPQPRCPSLRRATYGGSHAPRPVLDRIAATFPSATVVNAFGQSELSGTCCLLQGDETFTKHGSIGRAAFHAIVSVVDEHGRPVEAAGTPGELVVRGPTVMVGYLDDPASTSDVVRDGRLHTGDIAWQDEDGCFWLLGRRGDLILSGGENVFPTEVEDVVREHPAVADCAVVGVAHPRWVEAPVAVVVSQDECDGPPSTDDLRAFCQSRLAPYKLPRAVVVSEALPRNAAGKVNRQELRERHADLFEGDHG